MATVTMQTKTVVAEWSGLFQTELKTEAESLVFVKRMVALAVSSITYLRGMFPEEAYRSRYLDDVCIKILREDCRTHGANKVVKWLMGCFDAIEKHYLEVMFIGVSQHIIESYHFKFTYTANGPNMEIFTNTGKAKRVTIEDTKMASVLLVRKLFLLVQSLSALPQNIYMNMRLFYYDDITPDYYHPPGFKEGVCDKFWFEGTGVHFKVGEVSTAFHTLRVRVSAEQGRLETLKDSSNHSKTNGVPRNMPKRKIMKPLETKQYNEDEFPSEDESEQFKKPKASKGKGNKVKRLARKKKRI
ncbi:zebrafish testis-expressed 38 isoform X2 [Synchiropus splendidus]|uniref:zebrafish testis-expressed 38 isoform X2 n=1 Tax=Synchiropus splendidus TaxID=270530 RepID=UPI00237E2A5C|nr:zebrafish testis-expressed 38 isoform X2 [Synchiropus splendidus]